MSGTAVVLGVASVAAVAVLSPTALVGLVFISFPLGIIATVVGFVGVAAGGGRHAFAAAATGIAVASGAWAVLYGVVKLLTS